MSYKVRVYETTSGASSYTEIPANAIVNIDIDPNRASNDDPFEIVGRTAGVEIIRYDQYVNLLRGLEELSLKVTLGNINPKYNRDFYKNLVQIIDESTNAPIFTGLIPQNGISGAYSADRLEFKICDSLYVWISIAKQYQISQSRYSQTSLETQIGLPFSTLGAPLDTVSLDYGLFSEYIVEGAQAILPDLSKAPSAWYYYDVWTDPHEFDVATDWARISQDASVWQASGFIYISYFATFARRQGTQPALRCIFTQGIYKDSNLLQAFASNSGVLTSSYVPVGGDGFRGLKNLLIEQKVLPPQALSNTQNGDWVYGEQFEFTETNPVPLWVNGVTQTLSVGNQTITCNQPYFGQTKIDIDLNVNAVETDGTGVQTLAAFVKPALTVWRLGMRSLPYGGLELYGSLLLRENTDTPLAISDSDIIEIEESGTYADLERAVSALQSLKYSENAQKVFGDILAEALAEVKAVYRVTLPRTVYDANEWMPFMPITVKGITMYVYKWSEPTLEDTVTIEAFGGWI